MRLAFITQDFPPETGGIQTYAFELAKQLYPICEEFLLIAPAKPDHQNIDKSLPFRVIRITASNTLLGYKLIPKLKKIINEYKIEHTLHAQWQTAYSAIRLRKKGFLKSVSIAAHGRELLFNPFSKAPLIRRLYSKYQNRILRRADHFFPVSRFTANLLNGYIKEEDIHVVNNGTDAQRFFIKDASKLRQKLKLEDKLVLFTVCRHVKRKGIQDVIDALPDAIKAIPDLYYLIGGTGPYTDFYKKQVQQAGLTNHVGFTGKIPESTLLDYYNLCDIFIMTPREVLPDIEGFGIVYLEANACGKPVIGTISGGVTDAIQDEKTGLLIEREHPAAISQAIIRLAKDERLRNRLGNYAKDWVKIEMTWERAAQQIYQTIHQQ